MPDAVAYPVPPPGERPHVLLLTEGTYPYAVGGVSTWADLLVRGLAGIDWSVFAMTAGPVGAPALQLPPNAVLAGHLRLWGRNERHRLPGTARGLDEQPQESSGTGVRTGRRQDQPRRRRRPRLAAELARGFVGWSADPLDVVPALVWCRENPDDVVPTFREAATWERYIRALARILAEEHEEVGETPSLDLGRAIELYGTLSWVARAAAAPTPRADVSLLTAAGWCTIPAAVDKAIRGTPVLLAEHGIYVREAYLSAVRSSDSPAAQLVRTRLSRGLSRLAYRVADVVAPVTAAHRPWEEFLGADPESIVTIPNGVPAPSDPPPPPRHFRVASVGRIDPLKDLPTMLRVADRVVRRVPQATFLHYGPVPQGQEAYAKGCHQLHSRLGLGPSFRFMGPTPDPIGAVRDADVLLMTSISEGFPMSVLEALSQSRPVVTTLVGGVLDAMRGAGITAPPGDVDGLADGVTTLLLDHELAETLGRRGHDRVRRLFDPSRCLDPYRALLHAMATATEETAQE
ncbi:MAG: DUF3492 domain-containing protein [Actinomycetes bacterium]